MTKKYYLENKIKVLERIEKYTKDNYEKVQKWQKEYRAANKLKAKEYNKQYRQKNRQRLLKQKRDYYHKNKEKILSAFKDKYKNPEIKEKVAKRGHAYRQKNKQIIREKNKLRAKTDIKFRLALQLRKIVYGAAIGKFKLNVIIDAIGCTPLELKQHLESKFKPGMTWDNWGFRGWHIDHIVPLSAFDLTDKEQFLKASNYTNLQPLWCHENWTKGNKK